MGSGMSIISRDGISRTVDQFRVRHGPARDRTDRDPWSCSGTWGPGCRAPAPRWRGREDWIGIAVGPGVIGIGLAVSMGVAVLLGLPKGLRAQELTVERAVEMARQGSPLVRISSGRRLIAEGRGQSDGAWPNPVAEWRGENYSSPLPPDIFATLQLPIDLTGRRLALRQAQGLAARRGGADSLAVLRRLDHDVIAAYWRASLASELADIALSERDARERTATFDAERLREGAVAEVAAMRTRMEADRAAISAAVAAADAARASAELARLMGVDPAAIGELAALAPGVLAAVTATDTSWVGARERRHDLAALRLTVEESERRWRAESRGFLGDFHVVGGYKRTDGYTTGVAGVSVPLPLFNRNEGPRQQAYGEYLIALSAMLDEENRARGEILAAVRTLDALRSAGEAGAATMDVRASEIARIAEASYREGAISLIELIEAQRLRAEARAAVARWIVDGHLAVLELRRVTGVPFLGSP